jgi:hypothetical protein
VVDDCTAGALGLELNLHEFVTGVLQLENRSWFELL